MNIGIKNSIPPEFFERELSDVLLNWANQEEKKFFEAIDEAADACKSTIEAGIYEGHGMRTGEYKKAFRLEDTQSRRHQKYKTWYVEAPYYRLTHLLENGHATRDGTGRMTTKIEHIGKGQEIAQALLKERLDRLWGG